MSEWFDYIKNNPDKPWNYSYLSKHPNITWEIVQNNPDFPWEYNYLSNNHMCEHEFFKKQLSYVLK